MARRTDEELQQPMRHDGQVSEDRADDPPTDTSSVPTPNETADSQVNATDSAPAGSVRPLRTRLLIAIAGGEEQR